MAIDWKAVAYEIAKALVIELSQWGFEEPTPENIDKIVRSYAREQEK